MHNTTDHTTSIVKIEINALGEATQSPQSISENFTSYDTQGNGEIQISTDGNYLSYYNTNSQAKANPWTQTSQAEIRRWKITNQYTLESNATTIPIARHIGKGSLADNGTTLYYTQHSDEVGKEYQIHQYNNNGQHSTQIITGGTELRINTENNAYYYPQGTQGGQQYQPAPSPLQAINAKQTNTGNQAYHPYVINNPSGVTQGESYRYVSSKKYEIKDHLGNVRVVVSDRKESLKAQVASYGNFYPFGMQQPGRNFNDADGAYRYGFQGQEKDDELKGEGNSINYKYRMHDPRVGRFFSTDPMSKVYSFYSTYQFSGNRVVDAIELEGLEPHILFSNITDAAGNFGKQYNGWSISNKKEVAAQIYKTTDVHGNVKYAYTTPVYGGADSVPVQSSDDFPKDSPFTIVGDLHTHGNDDNNRKTIYFRDTDRWATDKEIDYIRKHAKDNKSMKLIYRFEILGGANSVSGDDLSWWQYQIDDRLKENFFRSYLFTPSGLVYSIKNDGEGKPEKVINYPLSY